MVRVRQTLCWFLTSLAVVATLAMPALSQSVGGGADPTSSEERTSGAEHHHHNGHLMHGHAHDSLGHASEIQSHADPHANHASCNLMACCPVASLEPRLNGRSMAAELVIRNTAHGCSVSQAPPETSDKPPRHIRGSG